jgi:hypothetical protein
VQNASKVSCVIEKPYLIKDGVDGDASIVWSLSECTNHLLDVRFKDMVETEEEDMFPMFCMKLCDREELPGFSGSGDATKCNPGDGIERRPLLRNVTDLFCHFGPAPAMAVRAELLSDSEAACVSPPFARGDGDAATGAFPPRASAAPRGASVAVELGDELLCVLVRRSGQGRGRCEKKKTSSTNG